MQNYDIPFGTVLWRLSAKGGQRINLALVSYPELISNFRLVPGAQWIQWSDRPTTQACRILTTPPEGIVAYVWNRLGRIILIYLWPDLRTDNYCQWNIDQYYTEANQAHNRPDWCRFDTISNCANWNRPRVSYTSPMPIRHTMSIEDVLS